MYIFNLLIVMFHIIVSGHLAAFSRLVWLCVLHEKVFLDCIK